ncbi:hypothetical protein NW765_009758 [Fusarium oxysporum]|nr:hypothetical protein NW765_009758 [Fusarium oxysporum]
MTMKKMRIGDIICHQPSFLLASERKSFFLCSLQLFLMAILSLALNRVSRFFYQTNTFEFEASGEFMEFQRYRIAPNLKRLLTHIDTPVSIEFSDLVCYGSELEKTGRPQPTRFTMLCHTLSKMKQELNLRFHVHMSNGEPWPKHTAESKRLASQAIKVGLETLVGNGRVTCVIDGCGMDGFSELVKGIWSKKLEGG